MTVVQNSCSPHTVLKDYHKIDASKVTLDAHFINDLGLDSLDQVELMSAIEEEFGVEIPDSEAENLQHPKDVAKWLSEQKAA